MSEKSVPNQYSFYNCCICGARIDGTNEEASNQYHLCPLCSKNLGLQQENIPDRDKQLKYLREQYMGCKMRPEGIEYARSRYGIDFQRIESAKNIDRIMQDHNNQTAAKRKARNIILLQLGCIALFILAFAFISNTTVKGIILFIAAALFFISAYYRRYKK